jgi:site-specific recombinase XerC
VRVRPASTARNGHDDGPAQHLDLHELRHTGATVIFQRTGDLNAGRAQLGHAKESMTINYIHPEDERGLEVVAAYTAQVVPLRRRQVS